MFDKLKLRLISINMALLTTVFITSNNINREINVNLNALIHNSKRPIPHSVNIVVELSNNGTIKKQFKSYEVSTNNDTLQSVVNKILESGKDSGKIDISSNTYSYLKSNSRFGTKIAFMERSQYDNMLFQLLKTLVLIGFISLIVLLFIFLSFTITSNLFSSIAMKKLSHILFIISTSLLNCSLKNGIIMFKPLVSSLNISLKVFS